ncbi:conjugal transfer protein TraN [Celeribacter naphthalenivorans]|uniref:conjugal transfer protein TraN n=1 Tax=Celeribacter naphthalenivorans TaxID=1614694 RepID=UPI001CFC1340|nr:conjugal transfer protein TraN [Celeribacter naphthalenivorans]
MSWRSSLHQIALSFVLAGTTGASFAEDIDPTQRAKDIGATVSLGSGSSVFTNSTVTETVTPYGGTDVEETSINGNNIESRTNEQVISGSTASEAYQNINDSSELRPDYDLNTDYFGIQAGDAATINAEEIAGQYFSSSETENPACNFDEFSVLEPFERYCDVHANLEEKTCTIERVVEVDRRDDWQCDIAQTDLTVTCEVGDDGECDIADLPEGNPGNQCTFIEERCTVYDDEVLREPAIGSVGPDNWYSSYTNSFVYPGTANYIEGINCGTLNAGVCSEGLFAASFLVWDRNIIINGYSSSAPMAYTTFDETGYYNPADGWTYHVDTSTFVGGDMMLPRYAIYRTKTGDGECIEKERDYICLATDQCESLRENELCEQTGTDCLSEKDGLCELERLDYSCFNDLTNHTPATLVETEILRVEDFLINQCDPDPAEEGCIVEELTCTVGEEIRTVMGFPVSRDCWEYEQAYTCLGDSSTEYTDCTPFREDETCEVISETCLTYGEADETDGLEPDQCVHWEYGYRCGGGIDLPESCTATNVCVGDLCEGITDEANTDFGEAAAWLTLLDEAAKDSEKSIDLQNVELFSGTARKCKVGAAGTINCCKDSGWANDILGDCSTEELALMDRIQADAAKYVGTYCSKRALGVCLQKKRSYCTFNSQLAMVFQKEIHRLTETSWGSAKHPSCGSLSLSQIDELDWDQIDLSEAFENMFNDADVETSDTVTEYLRDRLELAADAVKEAD